MQAKCRHKRIIFILPFLLLFFCGLQDYTYSALCFIFLSLHVLNMELQKYIYYWPLEIFKSTFCSYLFFWF
jgi:hypothetical protein